MRRATHSGHPEPGRNLDFYPRSPCGERPTTFKCRQACQKFLSTLSLRRATNHRDSRRLVENAISIHALLAESDTIFAVRPYDAPIFLSTLSLRRATLLKERTINWHQFLSTLSLRRATPRGRFPVVFYLISIHALLAESDVLGWLPVGQTQRFLSTLSLRRATDWFFTGTLDPKFLSTLSLRRATHHGTNSGTNSTIFLSTLSLRRATRPQPPKARVL